MAKISATILTYLRNAGRLFFSNETQTYACLAGKAGNEVNISMLVEFDLAPFCYEVSLRSRKVRDLIRPP